MSALAKKVFCVRLDKIGDLVSTLPVDEVFFANPASVKSEIHWVISKGLGFLAEFAEPRRQACEIELSLAGRNEFRALLRREKPDLVVIFYAPWWAAYECFRAGVPLRVGRRSQWHSFLFLTHGLRQSRSQSQRHEADYNFELAVFANEILTTGQTRLTAEVWPKATPILKLKAPLLRQLFEKFPLRRKAYVVVHPGMAGSALNWPVERYQELIQALLAKDPVMKVLVTGTTMDTAWTEPVLHAFQNHPRVISAVNALNLRELLFVLENARAVVVPSTGVAHLAASLGVQTRALYSPVLAHSAKRWGARGAEVMIFEPPVNAPSDNPMSAIAVAPVLASIPMEQASASGVAAESTTETFADGTDPKIDKK